MKREDVPRCRKLGKVGEKKLAFVLLDKGGFKEIIDVNVAYGENFPFADLTAVRNGKKYAISVKSRNKFIKGSYTKLNDRYKLSNHPDQLPRLVEEAVNTLKAIPAFLAIPTEPGKNTFSGYFGELSILRGNAGVPMRTPDKDYECLGKNLQSVLNLSDLKN
jgi:hypothetical protein